MHPSAVTVRARTHQNNGGFGAILVPFWCHRLGRLSPTNQFIAFEFCRLGDGSLLPFLRLGHRAMTLKQSRASRAHVAAATAERETTMKATITQPEQLAALAIKKAPYAAAKLT